MINQLSLAIGSGPQNRTTSKTAEVQDNTGSETGSEPDETDRFRNRSTFRNRSSSVNPETYDRFRNSSPTGNRKSGTGIPTAGPLTRAEECSLTLPSSPGGQGDRGQEPDTIGAGPVSALRTDPKPPQQSSTGTAPALRPYQSEAITAVEREFEQGRKRTLLVQATGTGKTVCFAEWIRRGVEVGERALVIAHRTELIEQAVRKLADVGIRASVDQGASVGSRNADVVVGSVQTLRGARLERHAPNAFRRVVVDEAHHSAAASYKAILERFASALVLGVTATPDRADGRALGEQYESVAFTYEMRTAIREGFLAPLRARRVIVADLDLTSIRSHHGDFDLGELAQVLLAEKALHGVVSPLVQLAGDRKTLVFGVDVAHAKALAEVINRHKPGAAIALDGSAKDAERKAVLALFRRGSFQYLVNCALFTEGFDEPSIECVALCRPTQSRALHTQMIGRGTRLSPETGKTDALILDFVGNSKHRLISPADALAGMVLDDATREAAEKQLDGQTELEDVLVHAEAEAARKRDAVKLIAIAVYRQKEIDVFLGDQMPKLDPSSPAYSRPATDKQLEAIEKAGLGKPPPGLLLGEASAMLDAVRERERLGLASVPQAKLLRKFGVDTKAVRFARAGELIAILRMKKYVPWALRSEPEWSARKFT